MSAPINMINRSSNLIFNHFSFVRRRSAKQNYVLAYIGISHVLFQNRNIYYGVSCNITTLNIKCHSLKLYCKNPCNIHRFRNNVTVRRHSKAVLGIETSCDDTGAAVVDEKGNVIGEELHSQQRLHTQFGGILPPLAKELHKQHIGSVVQSALQQSGLSVHDLDAIATTVKPGLPWSLQVGLDFSKELIKEFRKPFIPIHHMEAHALTARMIEQIDFPFLVLLASGGHCLLSVVRDVDDFVLIGQCMDKAPGDTLDKIARRLRLKNLSEYSDLSGGRAVELAAQAGDPLKYPRTHIMSRRADCNFSFGGLITYANKIIEKDEEKYDIKGGTIVPTFSDICASIQYQILHHLAKRVQRGLLFCNLFKLLPENPTLVVSGGVASNMFIRKGLETLCSHYDCRLVCPPPKLCTDNGIMIAWNGMEKLKKGIGTADVEKVTVHHRCPLGEDWTEKVLSSQIRLKRIKLLT